MSRGGEGGGGVAAVQSVPLETGTAPTECAHTWRSDGTGTGRSTTAHRLSTAMTAFIVSGASKASPAASVAILNHPKVNTRHKALHTKQPFLQRRANTCHTPTHPATHTLTLLQAKLTLPSPKSTTPMHTQKYGAQWLRWCETATEKARTRGEGDDAAG